MQKSDMTSRGDKPDWYLGSQAPSFGDYFGSVSSLAVGETYLTYDRKYIVHRVAATEFHVSRNACAHAGAPILETPGVQDVDNLRCPIHKWTYDLKGQLKAAPQFKSCHGVSLSKPDVALWNGNLVGFRKEETESLSRFGASLSLPRGAFDTSAFVFMGEERYPIPYPRELMLVNYFDGYHVPLYHQKTFAAVANCDSYAWEFSEQGAKVGYSIQVVRARSDVEKERRFLMQRGLAEEDIGWATFHLWIRDEFKSVERPIDADIFAVWASLYGNGFLMPELYEGGLFLAMSYLVNEDPGNAETGNANLVEYYVHKNVPEARRKEAARRFQHAYEQSAREDDEICETLYRSHRHRNFSDNRIYHQFLEAGDVHWREWYKLKSRFK